MSARAKPDWTRLYLMVGLFVIVLMLFFVARRPDTWSPLLPDEPGSASPAPTAAPVSPIDAPSDPRTAANGTPSTPVPEARNGGNRLVMGLLIALGVVYLAWRVSMLCRSLIGRATAGGPNRARPAASGPGGAARVAGTSRADSRAPEKPVPDTEIEEPPAAPESRAT